MDINTYIMTVVAVILTILCGAAGMLFAKLSWTIVIEPIIDSISDARDLYWQKRWNECNDIRHKLEVTSIERNKLLRKLGLNDEIVKHIYSINVIRREDLNERGNLEMKIHIEVEPEEKKNGNTK